MGVTQPPPLDVDKPYLRGRQSDKMQGSWAHEGLPRPETPTSLATTSLSGENVASALFKP